MNGCMCPVSTTHSLPWWAPFRYSLELDDYIITSTSSIVTMPAASSGRERLCYGLGGQLRSASRRAAGQMTSIKLMHVGIWPPSPSDLRVDSRNQALGSNPCFASLGIPSPRSGVQSALVPSHSQGGSPASLGLAIPTQTRKSIFFQPLL